MTRDARTWAFTIDERPVIIEEPVKRGHFFVIGKTRMGKSTFFEHAIRDDIDHERGFCLIDPHGDLAERVLDAIPRRLINRTIYLNVGDFDYPFGFNIFDNIPADQQATVGQNVIGIFKRIYSEFFGPRMEFLWELANLALLTSGKATLLNLERFLTDPKFRASVIAHPLLRDRDPLVREFWAEKFPRWPEHLREEAIIPIVNKIGQVNSNPILRRIVNQTDHRLDLSECFSDGRFVIVNLAQGLIGTKAASLLGSLFVSALFLSALGRTKLPPGARTPFRIYIDEIGSFADPSSLPQILAESAKYGLSLWCACQYLNQLPDIVRDALLGNATGLIAFRIGADDAETLAREVGLLLPQQFEQLVTLDRHEFFYREFGATVGSALRAKLNPPPSLPTTSCRSEIINQSRRRYCTPCEKVDADLLQSRNSF
ncbi:TraM recognition domain-containing protein [Candidatus Acetothermia bacterium]|nr:TraM recognition domain-containing protein [Candidatus Acetothermia bacterium]